MFNIWIFHSKRSFLSLMVIGLLLALLGMTAITALAAVTLTSFAATPGNGQVLVTWQTATESDNAGFFVYRSIHTNSGFAAISPLIPPSGNGSTGGQYSYLDTNVSNGITYYYELAAVNSSNQMDYFTPVGPIVPGAAAATATGTTVVTRTPTATGPTITRTSTPTFTTTPPGAPTVTLNSTYPGPVQSPYPGAIQTPNPTQLQTFTPILVTPTPTSPAQTPETGTTSVNLSSQPGAPTSTLRPFPSVTYEFPDASQASVVSIQSTPQPGDKGLSGWVNVARLGPLTLILLVWVLLGGWFYLTLRRME